MPEAGALQYGWPEGSERLRGWIAERLRARGARVEPGDVLVTSGAQQALAVAAQVLLREGDAVEVGPASYPAALDLFRMHGARTAAAAPDARFVYAMPAVANPCGCALPEAERAALLARGATIVEDDAYADLRFEAGAPRPLLADAPDRVWHVGTFSKSICPGLRVGWLIPPPAQRAAALHVKQASDLEANRLGQAILEQFLPVHSFDAMLARARRFYRRRAERLARSLRRHLPSFRHPFPQGGFSIWVETDVAGDEIALLERGLAEGVAFDPGHVFRPESPGGEAAPIALRLSFSSLRDDEIDAGVQRLARAFRGLQASMHTTATPSGASRTPPSENAGGAGQASCSEPRPSP